MTIIQAKELYLSVAGEDARYLESEWEDIHKEMEDVVSAKSDRAAANIIRWWDCWDEKYTATQFARRLRNKWKENLQRCEAGEY